jgi:integrase
VVSENGGPIRRTTGTKIAPVPLSRFQADAIAQLVKSSTASAARKASLPLNRRLHPHGLRHFAATSWLRGRAGLDEVRRPPGHESLSTTLRYSSLVGADLQGAHKRAGAIERLRLA